MPKTDNRAGRRAEAAEKRGLPGSLRVKEEERRGEQERNEGEDHGAYLLSTQFIKDATLLANMRRSSAETKIVPPQLLIFQYRLSQGEIDVKVSGGSKVSISDKMGQFSDAVLRDLETCVQRALEVRRNRMFRF